MAEPVAVKKTEMENQLGVLNALDAAKTQWYHFTAI
ncbi:hypothetical protein Gotur_026952, partial [Gossypium turneri]